MGQVTLDWGANNGLKYDTTQIKAILFSKADQQNPKRL